MYFWHNGLKCVGGGYPSIVSGATGCIGDLLSHFVAVFCTGSEFALLVVLTLDGLVALLKSHHHEAFFCHLP